MKSLTQLDRSVIFAIITGLVLLTWFVGPTMRFSSALPAFTLLFAVTSLASAGNWDRFRGPNGSGIVSDKNIPLEFGDGKNVLWKMRVPGFGHSSPVVWGKHLFLQSAAPDSSERFLLCIDAEKGQELWRRGIPGVKHPTRGESSPASSTPVTDGEGVYIAFWDGKEVHFHGYDFKGNLLWSKNLGPWISQHGAGGSPILYKDKVILAHDMDKEAPSKDKKAKPTPVHKPSTLYAFNKKTGDIAWEVPREAHRACYSAPFILQTKGQPDELIITSTTSVASYDPETGAQNWKWHWDWKVNPMPLRTIAATIHVDGTMISCSGDGGGARQAAAFALNGHGKSAKPSQVWNNIKDFPYVPCLLNKGEHIFFVNDAGAVGCYEAKTGKRVWFERVPDTRFCASPILIDDKIYAAAEDGDVHVFAADPSAFRPLAKSSLGELIRATPAVADGKLYIRTVNHLYCIGQK